MRRDIVFLTTGLVFTATPALAVQAHGGQEGLMVHQLSHLFFAFSMGLLIYWLRRRGLEKEPGWRAIQYSAVLFILWTMDAFTAHLMGTAIGGVTVRSAGRFMMDIRAFRAWLGFACYAVKLDHLLCVPGIVLLYLGLRRLSGGAADEG